MTVQSEQIAGTPDTFMRVKHLTVTGTQREIGHALAAAAVETYAWKPQPVQNRAISRARRTWFQRNWTQQYERMLGAAEFAGVDPEADEVHLDGWGGVPQGSGCSVLWAPPDATAEGHGLIGRNYDLLTLSAEQMFAMISGQPLTEPPTDAPMYSAPYVVTCRPDEGLASVFVASNDLSGCSDGINEKGLAIMLLMADAENAGAPVNEAGPQVGVESTQVLRYVLDTCADVDEAKAAMLGAKYYDYGLALHYLVADASGRAFVWERSKEGNEYIIDADGATCVTNHLLHRYPNGTELPPDNDETMSTFGRSTALQKQAEFQMSHAGIRAALDEVRFNAANAGAYPVRSLWRTMFDVTEGTMAAQFYMGDDAEGEPTYSEELVFSPN